MLGWQRRAIVAVDDPGFVVRHVGERKIGEIAAIAESQYIGCLWLGGAQDRVERDPRPPGIELRPLGNAVDVNRDGRTRQGMEFVPVPPLWHLDGAHHTEVPLVFWHVGCWPGREHWKIFGEVLPRRETIRLGHLAPFPDKAPREKSLSHTNSFHTSRTLMEYMHHKGTQLWKICSSCMRPSCLCGAYRALF